MIPSSLLALGRRNLHRPRGQLALGVARRMADRFIRCARQPHALERPLAHWAHVRVTHFPFSRATDSMSPAWRKP